MGENNHNNSAINKVFFAIFSIENYFVYKNKESLNYNCEYS